jgi:hypothetical protein
LLLGFSVSFLVLTRPPGPRTPVGKHSHRTRGHELQDPAQRWPHAPPRAREGRGYGRPPDWPVGGAELGDVGEGRS